MQGRRVLFFDPDGETRKLAERALVATGSDVVTLESPDQLGRAVEEGADLVMSLLSPELLATAGFVEVMERVGARFPRQRLVLHATGPTETYVPLMNGRSWVRNLIAKNGAPLEADEVITTAEKILRNDVFGLEKYLLWGVHPVRVQIADSEKKAAYVRQVSEYATRLGCSARTIELIETIVDEVVTNAIFNAPRDRKTGQPRYAALDRRERVQLKDDEVAELQFACDGDYIAVSQTDHFGALTQETVVAYLLRCFEEGPRPLPGSGGSAGAGTGLYRVFRSLSKFIVNVLPGQRTEVIALIDLRWPMKRFRQLAKSFHIFVQDGEGESH
jgi:hypothetical protein